MHPGGAGRERRRTGRDSDARRAGPASDMHSRLRAAGDLRRGAGGRRPGEGRDAVVRRGRIPGPADLDGEQRSRCAEAGRADRRLVLAERDPPADLGILELSPRRVGRRGGEGGSDRDVPDRRDADVHHGLRSPHHRARRDASGGSLGLHARAEGRPPRRRGEGRRLTDRSRRTTTALNRRPPVTEPAPTGP
ncbi:hypothetical protein MICRO8M_130041 [Microbacterium sp. 8M]|nr:hypothetical protein MICRO8M_130041 [Microbacterium sp. 8M]